MNIYTVRDNLVNTISGKQALLNKSLQDMAFDNADPLVPKSEQMARRASIEFLKINIDELKKILADIEKCCEQAIEDSWALNPERMGR